MKSGVKTAVSLLIAILIFGGITVLSSLGMFSTVEKRFYEPARLKAINGKLDSVADCSNEYITNLLSLLGYGENGFLSSESVSSFVNQAPSDDAVRLFDSLRENLPGLDGMRIVDSNGRRVHFSSYRNDFTISGNRRNYSNYENLKTVRGKDELAYSVVTAFGSEEDEKDTHSSRIIFDGEEQRIVVSYRFFAGETSADGYSVLFYINPFDLANKLVENHLVSINEPVTLISSSDGKTGGFVFGLPQVGQNIFAVEILKKWNEKASGPDVIVSSENANLSGITVDEATGETSESEKAEKSVSWSLISSQKGQFMNVGGLYTSESLEMPGYVRILLLICAFITVCLIIVILFNVRRDDDVIIKAKIKAVQIGLLNEYFEKDVDRKKVAAMIEAQKDALTAKIKKSLGRRGKKYGDNLDVILNRSWEDIISILSGNGGAVSGGNVVAGGISSDDMQEIRKMFEEILSSGTLKVAAVAAPVSAKAAAASRPAASAPAKAAVPAKPAVANPEPVEDLDEVESLEDAEPLDEVESLEDAEPLDEVEPLEDAEPLDEVEPLEDVESLEEVESLTEVEPVEDLSDAEPVEDAESVEDLSDAEPLDEVESLEDAEPLEDVESLDEVEPVEDAESVEEAEAVPEPEVVEELDDAEALEPVEEPLKDSEVQELEDAEPLEEVEPAEDAEAVEELSDAEPLEEVSSEPEAIELEGEAPALRTLDDTIVLEKSEPVEELDEISEENTTENPENAEYKVDPVDDVIELGGYEGTVNKEDESTTYTQTSAFDRSHFEGSEPLEIADHTVSAADDSSDEFDFQIFKPMDYIFDDSKDEKSEVKADNEEKIESVEEVSETAAEPENEPEPDPEPEALLLELPAEKDGFMFTTFAANDNNVTELSADAIVMGEDGVFHISENLSPLGMPVDEEFKKLVDSVIR